MRSIIIKDYYFIIIRAKIFFCPVPKISQVMMKWRRRASDHGRFTLWHNGRQAALLGRLTLWHNQRRATQLGRFTLWHNGRRAKQPGFIDACTRSHTHFPKTVPNHAENYEGLIQSKILFRVLNALEDSTNTDR